MCAVAVGFGAEAGGPVFVQGSSINLREQPNAQSHVVKVVPIATPCTVLREQGGGWAEVHCDPDVEGFAKLEFLGPTKPELAPLLEQAKSASLDLKQRMNFALRAAALVPDNGDARSLVKQYFFDTEFDSLKDLRTQREAMRAKKASSKARKARMAQEVSARPFRFARCTAQQQVQDCLLSHGDSDFETAVVRGNDAVIIFGGNDVAFWDIQSGSVAWNDSHDSVTFTVEKKFNQQPNGPLYTSLSGKPFDPSRADRLAEQANWRLLEALPKSWYGAEVDGNYVSVDCNGTLGYGIDLKSDGASWVTGGLRDSNVDPIQSVEHPSKNEYVFHIRDGRMTLEYPPTSGPLAGKKNAAWMTWGTGSPQLLIDKDSPGRARIASHCFEGDGEGPP
jgi:hypothetical protein